MDVVLETISDFKEESKSDIVTAPLRLILLALIVTDSPELLIEAITPSLDTFNSMLSAFCSIEDLLEK